MQRFILLLVLCSWSSLARADQPIFGMMPRWDNGWGVQMQHEYQALAHAQGHLVHVEGVYTWRRWIRVTYKIPWVLTGQSLLDKTLPTESGLGTPIVALPLKKYFNKDGRSGAWSLTPHLFLPLSQTELGREDEHGGLSFGFAQETYRTTLDLAGAVHFQRAGFRPEWHLHGAVGGKFYGWDSAGNFKLKFDLRYTGNGDHAVRIAPVVYWRLSDRWHAQIGWKHSLLAQGFDDGDWIRSGIGMVF